MATIASATARSVVAVLCVPVLAEVTAKDKVWSYLDEIQEDRDGRVLTELSCPATCYGRTCDYWVQVSLCYSCDVLTYAYECDCGGCSLCSPMPATPEDGDDVDQELTTSPHFGDESKMDHLSDGIFALWWQQGFDTLPVAREAAKIFKEVRADAHANGMPDPPNPSRGYYFNVYIHRGDHDDFPTHWGNGVSTSTHDCLPYMTIGAHIDTLLWYHEGFHVFQYNTRGVQYKGDTMWATEATASWYAVRKDPSNRWAFVYQMVVSNSPHRALWHSFTNGPSGENEELFGKQRQYGIHSMLWYITEPQNGNAPLVDGSLIYAALNHETPYPGGLQGYLGYHALTEFRQGFLDWAAQTTNNHAYMTSDQIEMAQWYLDEYTDPSMWHPYAATVERRTENQYVLRPDSALKPRGWSYNVIMMSDTAPGNYTFSLLGDVHGSSGALAVFKACALVGSGASAKVIYFDMSAEHPEISGVATVPGQPSGGTIKLIIAATPYHFVGNQNYGYEINVQFSIAAPTAAPPSCDCECHDDRYAPDDRNDPPNDCWIPGFGYDRPCCLTPAPTTAPTAAPTAAPPSCDCECHGDQYAPDDRNDPPNDCWIPGFGYDRPCCLTPAPTTGTCADTDDGAADDDGDDCAGYTANPGWCSYHDDADFTSSVMCCACGGGEYQAVLFEQPNGDQEAQRNIRGTAPTPAITSAPLAVPDGYTMHAGMGSGPGYTADGGWIRISVMEGTTVLQCADACDQLSSCAGFTMLLDSNTCNLKSAVALTIPTDGIHKDTYVKEAPTL